MPRTLRRIPNWYTDDWTPATARNEMSAMRWEDIESAFDDLITHPDKRRTPKALVRTLWLESSDLTPMELLQQLLLVLARSLSPGRPPMEIENSHISTPAVGPLPRWSYTDLEVALSYTWSGLALSVASARHHDCLTFRDDRLTGQAMARQLLLLVCGLPTPASQTAVVIFHPEGRRTAA